MRITLNGTPTELPGAATVLDAAVRAGVRPDEPGVAVAVQTEVVPRARWADTPLPEGAAVEVVRAAAGG